MTIALLLVEDEPRIREALSMALRDEGYRVAAVATGEAALQNISTGTRAPDLVLLDLMLPGMDGVEVCRRARERSDVPIIMVTARTDSSDVIAGLEAGADDYVTKPLNALELSARIRALLRRSHTDPKNIAQSSVWAGDIIVDATRGVATRDGSPIHLTKTEFRLLFELAAAEGGLVTRERLLQRVWDYDYFGDTRLLDVHIRRLRRKIEHDPGRPMILRTVRGAGYRIDR